MAPDWRNPPPPRAGPSDARPGVVPNPRDRPSQTEDGGEDGRDKPQFEWVYNSDHTDPVNFGYMFLKPVGTRPTRANAGSSHITVRAPNTSAAPRQSESPPQPVPPSSTTNQGYRQPSQSSAHSRSYGYSKAAETPSRHISPGSQPYTEPPYTPSPRHPVPESSSQASIHHQLPYRSSPHHGISANPSPQQLTPPESLQWRHHGSIPVAQDFGLTGVNLQAHRNIFNHSNEYPSQGFVGPVSSATPTPLTPEDFIPPPLPVSKGKRKLSTSPVISQATNPLGGLQTSIRKRRIQLNDVQQSRGFESNLSICEKCQQHLIPGSDQGVCASCQYFTDIYTWPSISASRLESLESLVLLLMPSHMEECLLLGAESIPRGRSWRPLAYKIPHSGSDLSTLEFQDQWTLSKQQTRSIGLYGSDYEELADIAQTFQRSIPIRNICLEAACTTLIAVCDLYKCVIAPPNTTGILSTTPLAEVLSHVRTVRITLRNAFQQLQYLATSPSTTRSRQDWLPAFLSANILITTAVIFLDILGQFPSPYREQIWGPKWHDRIVEMRNGGYGIMLALLRANTNGINPLKMDCWTGEPPPKSKDSKPSSPFIISTPKSYTKTQSPKGFKDKDKGKGIAPLPTKRKDKIDTAPSYFWNTPGAAQPDQDVLLGSQSPAALQGLVSLKAWQKRYGDHLELGKDMFNKERYAVAMIRPVAYLSKIFEM